MAAILLALLTALSYGLANYLGPVLTRVHPLAGVLLVGQTVGVVLAGGLLLLDGSAAPDAGHGALGLLAGVCNGIALAAIYAAAAAGPISIVTSIGATGSMVPVAVALVTGERPSYVQLVGIPLAMVGVVLFAARKAGTPQQAAPRTVVLALLSALFFGGFLALFGAASQDGPSWAVFSSRVSLVLCTMLVVVVRRLPVRVPGRALPALAVPGALLLIGTASYGAATTRGLVSVVAVLATLAPVVTVALAVVLQAERLALRQQVGIATALTGVVLLAAG